MEIKFMNKINNKSTKAFFSLQLKDGTILKGLTLVEGRNGLFVNPPRTKGKDGKYYDSIIFPREVRAEITDLAIKEYKGVESEKTTAEKKEDFPF